jgi:hypothetical protein
MGCRREAFRADRGREEECGHDRAPLVSMTGSAIGPGLTQPTCRPPIDANPGTWRPLWWGIRTPAERQLPTIRVPLPVPRRCFLVGHGTAVPLHSSLPDRP